MEQTNQDHQVLKNDNIRFSIHYKPSCIVEYDIEALEPLVETAHKKAVKAVSKQVTFPGFRKGKAPESLVVKNYPKEIDKELQQEIANAALIECQKLSQVPFLHKETKVHYNLKSHSTTGALLTLSFETEPKIPSIDPKEFQLKTVKRPEVNEDKVNETVRQMQMFFATWTPANDRPVQEGDFVLLDVDVIEEEPPTPLFSHTRFEVTEKSMAKWMYDLVLGKKQTDTIDGISVPDETASEEEKEELKPKKVRLTIKNVETATFPELDDIFAKKLGADSVEDMKSKIHTLLTKQADAHVQEAEREQASEFLLNQYPFDLPRSLIDRETQFRFSQLTQDNEFQSYWKQLNDEERRKIVKTIHEQSEKAVRMFYLCRHIVSEAKIQITPTDVEAPANSALEMLMNPQKLFHHQRTPEIEHAEAFSRLVLEKAEDFVINQAKSTQPE